MENQTEMQLLVKKLCSYRDAEPLIIMQDTADRTHEVVLFLNVYVRTVTAPDKPPVHAVELKMCLDTVDGELMTAVRTHGCKLFHPNFTDDGEWCCAQFASEETVPAYLIRLISSLQYKRIDTDCIANRNAMAWYHHQKRRGMFPIDPVNYHFPEQITILHVNQND